MANAPLIYSPGDEPLDQDGVADPQTAVDPFELDEDSHPWLREMSERQLAELAVDLTTFICRPSFGARTKREIELQTFELLRAHRRDWTSLGEIADDLAVSRSKARALSLDYQARRVGARPRGERRTMLRDFVHSWPTALIQYDDERLRLVIDDPFMRDLLKNFAYARGILIDHSFAPEIQVFRWSAYAALLEALQFDRRIRDDDFQTFTATLRRQILRAASRDALANAETKKQLAEVEKAAQDVLKTKDEKRREAVKKFLEKYGPTVAGLAGKALIPAP